MRSLPGRGIPPGALRRRPQRGRDQLVLLPPASNGHLRALGRLCAGGLPLRREGPEGHHPRAPAERRGDLLDRFLSEVGGLGPKLGPLLVQLPPSLSFQAGVADTFPERAQEPGRGQHRLRAPPCLLVRARTSRRCSTELRIARVAADPAPVAGRRRAGRLARSVLPSPARLTTDLLLGLRPGVSAADCGAARRGCGRARSLVHLRQHGGLCGNHDALATRPWCRVEHLEPALLMASTTNRSFRRSVIGMNGLGPSTCQAARKSSV